MTFIRFSGVRWDYDPNDISSRPRLLPVPGGDIWINPNNIAAITTAHHERGEYSALTTAHGETIYVLDNPATVMARIEEETR